MKKTRSQFHPTYIHTKKFRVQSKKNAIDGKFNWSMKYIGKWFLTMKLRSKGIFKINFFFPL